MEQNPGEECFIMKIVFTDYKSLGFPLDTVHLCALGDVTFHDDLTEEQLPQALACAEIVITNQHRLNSRSLAKAERLKLICEAGTGIDNIDLEYCRTKNIAVTNVPGYAGISVAQHTFAMLFYLLSHSRYYDDYVKDGSYAKAAYTTTHTNAGFYELAGKTWGILGLGTIGSLVAQYAQAFGCRVISSPLTSSRELDGKETVSLTELLENADILSIHAPLSPLTEHLIGLKELKKMKKNAILLNLGRGGIINEADLAQALDENLIYAAGLDVLAEEPIRPDNPLLGIRDRDRLYITPHIAYASVEARKRLIDCICETIEAFIGNGEIKNAV